MRQPHERLARAVIVQAFKDATERKDSYIRSEARSFLTGSSPTWAHSLRDWCQLGDVSYKKLSNKVKELKNNGWKNIKNSL